MIVKMGVKWGYSAVAELIDEGVDDQTRQDIKAIIAKLKVLKIFIIFVLEKWREKLS